MKNARKYVVYHALLHVGVTYRVKSRREKIQNVVDSSGNTYYRETPRVFWTVPLKTGDTVISITYT